ncbi:MAG: histidinol dehydrogenase, partial [Deltaproteobacteria bacterium]|nr:histidinol dehydrogenase [Deltaproteobacteria bacterium]
MIRIFKYPSAAARKRLDAIVNRGLSFKVKDLQAVERILNNVRKRKDRALINYINKFDAPKLSVKKLKVTKAEIEKA